MKTKLFFSVLPVLLLQISSVWAGGVHCAPGYCMDSDANGCHPCGFSDLNLAIENGKIPAADLDSVLRGDGAICCSWVSAAPGTPGCLGGC